MEWLYLLFGIIVGGALAYFYMLSKTKTIPNAAELEQIKQLEMQNLKLSEKLQYINDDAVKKNSDLEKANEEVKLINIRLAKAEEVFAGQKEKIEEHKKEKEELNKKLTEQFENIANRIMEEKSVKFTSVNRENLDQILTPFKERIKAFEEKVDTSYKQESQERTTLKTEIKNLVELNKQISEEANNLTRALKGDNKKQGNWGELMLEKVLERSGLVKGREYNTQVTDTNVDGDSIKPDVIINLPDDKHIIVDSKVSLIHYEQYSNEDDEVNRMKFLKMHVDSMYKHIKDLSDKNYHTAHKLKTPDFVLMFIPLESCFSVAIQYDLELFNYAWDRKIVLVSPSTLLATLKTIASIWKQENQTKNAMEIAKEGGALLDKFYSFMEDLAAIDKNIESTKKSYDNALVKLNGRGGIFSRIDKLRVMGAKSTKSLPAKFMDDEVGESDEI